MKMKKKIREVNTPTPENWSEDSPAKQDWEEEFNDFYWEHGQYRKRKLGIDGYKQFIQKLLSEQKAEMEKEMEKILKMKHDHYVLREKLIIDEVRKELKND